MTGEGKKDGQDQSKQQVITSKELETIKNPSSASVQINSFGQLSELDQKDNIREGPKAQFKINVNDTGRGIAPDFISHMYQPFSQVCFYLFFSKKNIYIYIYIYIFQIFAFLHVL
jgi:hypothetical protein